MTRLTPEERKEFEKLKPEVSWLPDWQENGVVEVAQKIVDMLWEKQKPAFISFIDQLLEKRQQEVAESKNGAYRERNMLVCALSKLFPAYLARHDNSDKEWEDDWRWIVYISLPTGQVSWHIHDSERLMFSHLEVKENNWDGHNTQRKYERLQTLPLLPNVTCQGYAKGQQAMKKQVLSLLTDKEELKDNK